MTATAGNRGDSVRSDCFVQMTKTEQQATEIRLQSKVESLYGDSIRELCHEVLIHYNLRNVFVEIEDKGALPFVTAARLESAIRELTGTEESFLLPVETRNLHRTRRDRTRRTRLYLPGNNPKLMLNAGIYGSDGIILDLEDSVAPDKKVEARLLVRNALRAVDFGDAERMVRINQLPAGLEDLDYIIPEQVNLILIPKCENAQQIVQVEERIEKILGQENTDIYLMPIIESTLGVVNAYEIASASPNVAVLAIGLEDYTADLGAQRTAEGRESFYARSAVVNAARAAGVQPIDSVFSEIDDMEALRNNVLESKALGFAGMGCIHPRQVPVINEGFSPDGQEIEKAKRIMEAFEQAREKGLGVVALGSKMIDAPVVKRAVHTIELAIQSGKLSTNWRENHE
ncbi:aldolase/citrate lyase family protein [Prolixibacter sp. NT017]|uniref:aldolase/citrate lyase family protein n=1 Tax=Prolixibacter sp. NT017 TaxID=2652390 RepID=UPI001E4CC519|nr:aldolase/citrate lyase family protein [Prolixibacter sp. NT017]